jgi:hypothetical protein
MPHTRLEFGSSASDKVLSGASQLAEDVQGEALATLVVNHLRGVLLLTEATLTEVDEPRGDSGGEAREALM